MKNLGRRILLLIAAALVCCPLLGCEMLGLTPPKKNPVSDRIEFDQEYYDSLEGIEKIQYERSLINDSVHPDLFYNGQTFGILYSPENDINDWQPEDLTGDRLNDAIHEMNQYVQDRLNIKLIYLDKADKADDLIAIDDKTYSVVADDYKTVGWLAADGLLRDWESMPNMDLGALVESECKRGCAGGGEELSDGRRGKRAGGESHLLRVFQQDAGGKIQKRYSESLRVG